MPRLLRIVFTWLLMLALPLQGQAAAAMLNCEPLRAAASADDHAQHAHHGHAAVADETQATPAHHGCSACAACCVGLALPSRAPQLASVPAAGPPQPAPAAAQPSFLTGGPERPPRAPLA